MSDTINVTVQQPAALSVSVPGGQGVAGPPGATGATGAAGPAGPAGPMGTTYTFTQASPSALWAIAHNLGRFPSITVADSSGREVEGDVQYVDANQLTVSFSAPFSGEAYLN